MQFLWVVIFVESFNAYKTNRTRSSSPKAYTFSQIEMVHCHVVMSFKYNQLFYATLQGPRGGKANDIGNTS